MKTDGIVMANGVILKDGKNVFKADRKLVTKSMFYIAKISRGLYSGILNSDPDFIKFQQESIDNIIKEETNKLCENIVSGADNKLKNLSERILAAKTPNYVYDRRGYMEVEPIEIKVKDEIIKERNKKTVDYSCASDHINVERLKKNIGKTSSKKKTIKKKKVAKKKSVKKKKNDRK